jgi:hydroxyacylglutathione hydrolase
LEIHMIDGGPYDSNMFLLREGDVRLLIDAGTGLAHRVVARNIRKMIGEDRLQATLLTHEHFDHCGGVNALSREFGGIVVSSKECASIVGGPNTLFTGAFLFGSVMEPIPDVRIAEERVTFGPIELQVIPSPGHCPGMVCYLHEGTGSLFCGDLIFCDGGVGRWDLPGGKISDHVRSIRHLRDLKVNGLYPGHGRIETEDARSEISKAISAMASM